jgi:proteasome lid subunit RPN8/RPN11
MSAERIGRLSEMPERLLLSRECLIVLRRTLAAPAPEEGCALLLGSVLPARSSAASAWWVRRVWPCCNVWRPGIEALPDPETALHSRRYRFAIDPREQLHAQRWSRSRKLRVLGTAHSHPAGEPQPSFTDQRWAVHQSLMVIMGASGELGAWWMEAGSALRLPVKHTDG